MVHYKFVFLLTKERLHTDACNTLCTYTKNDWLCCTFCDLFYHQDLYGQRLHFLQNFLFSSTIQHVCCIIQLTPFHKSSKFSAMSCHFNHTSIIMLLRVHNRPSLFIHLFYFKSCFSLLYLSSHSMCDFKILCPATNCYLKIITVAKKTYFASHILSVSI